ncbi:Hypothetical_protein [Hexamita inflata]|uniref:Hypothetical_protein n=1 Tax=Hexamita inflata TaxID=28002 RepID=A0AA86TIJ6_9EUKA|nr:Hypothetical protein HINF_LOCUS7349 [Hexamita inflata]CAI9972100.1 Hypothetical protein HINF_LOCUS59745 [Hexamita inflata]
MTLYNTIETRPGLATKKLKFGLSYKVDRYSFNFLHCQEQDGIILSLNINSLDLSQVEDESKLITYEDRSSKEMLSKALQRAYDSLEQSILQCIQQYFLNIPMFCILYLIIVLYPFFQRKLQYEWSIILGTHAQLPKYQF